MFCSYTPSPSLLHKNYLDCGCLKKTRPFLKTIERHIGHILKAYTIHRPYQPVLPGSIQAVRSLPWPCPHGHKPEYLYISVLNPLPDQVSTRLENPRVVGAFPEIHLFRCIPIDTRFFPDLSQNPVTLLQLPTPPLERFQHRENNQVCEHPQPFVSQSPPKKPLPMR